MKTSFLKATGLLLIASGTCFGQSTTYTNFIVQEQYEEGNPDPVTAIMSNLPSISAPDGQPSELAINPGGARFELYTMNSLDPSSERLLSSTYVSSYMPAVQGLTIISEDQTGTGPRTRADRPFQVRVTMDGILSGATDPVASKSVDFFHYAQSYGEGGSPLNIDPSQALEISAGSINTNGDHSFPSNGVGENNVIFGGLPVYYHSVPSADLTKARGEERFEIWALQDMDSGAPRAELASKTIQIWPVADGTIDGITEGQQIRYRMPQLTLTLNDLYPSSTTYLQAYPGAPALGTVGRVVSGSAISWNAAVPLDRVLVLQNYDEVITQDGLWTFELLTSTPFGIDRLAYVSFRVDRTLDVKASVNTLE